jgi:carboxyl-terminal processing protease
MPRSLLVAIAITVLIPVVALASPTCADDRATELDAGHVVDAAHRVREYYPTNVFVLDLLQEAMDYALEITEEPDFEVTSEEQFKKELDRLSALEPEIDLTYWAVIGMLESLDDPHTYYEDPYGGYIPEEVDFGFTTIGTEDGPIVWEVVRGSPAAKAGLKRGDLLLDVCPACAFDGTTTFEVKRSSGEFDAVNLPQESDDEIVWYNTAMIGDVAHLRFYTFDVEDDPDLAIAKLADDIRVLMKEKPRAWIFDMRGNSGGYLRFADFLSFLAGYRGILMEASARGQIDRIDVVQGEAWPVLREPIIVLQDNHSASTSEIVAEVLRQLDRAEIIGEVSAGSVRAASTFDLGPGWLQVTTALLRIGPDLTTIDVVGVKPDIEVEVTRQDLIEGRDPVLEKALEVIRQPVSQAP